MGDLIVTWLRFRPVIASLATSQPGPTSYMRRHVGVQAPMPEPTWVPLAQVSLLAACAVEAAEDPLHLSRVGLDWRRQAEVLAQVIRGRFASGGSGIQQQLARNLFLSADRTPRRKLRELVLAAELSRTLTPARQLELYLNVIEWGPGVWGIADAASHHFGRAPSDLRPTEAILLAAMLPAPGRGLEFAVGRSRAGHRERIARTLWEYGVLDTESAASTLARLDHIAAGVGNGMSIPEAQASTRSAFGFEPPMIKGNATAVTCDRTSRHLP